MTTAEHVRQLEKLLMAGLGQPDTLTQILKAAAAATVTRRGIVISKVIYADGSYAAIRTSRLP